MAFLTHLVRAACRPSSSRCLFSVAIQQRQCLLQRQRFATKQKQLVNVVFEFPDGETVKAAGREGDTLLDVVISNDVPIDGYGACEGTLACSTCHVVLSQKDYDALPETPLDEELDMLDLAFGLTDTSRLGCQIVLTPELEGLVVRVPENVHDARAD